MIGTFWSLIPAIIAIALALLTKEVYSSLFVGILMGGVFYAISTAAGFAGFLTHVFSDGLIAQLSDSYNAGILVFMVILGSMVALMNKAGGSLAFGNWAKKHIKTKVGAQLATVLLGVLIFIDDYFNCLTVGSVMKPVTDKYGVSKEKLAFLIDATAAPVCIIAPISSWAAAVSGFVTEGENGLALFCKAIPYNFYALGTLFMLVVMILMNVDFGAMVKFEQAAAMLEKSAEEKVEHHAEPAPKGKVIDLVLPIAILIVACTLGMIYSGGFFEEGETYHNFIEAFANSDASVGLVMGSFAALILTLVLYVCRNVLNFKDCMACIPDGFKAMVPAILILTLAWTLKGMTDSLGAKDYVAGIVAGSAGSLKNFLPAIVFVIACFLAFATGTSWGTFGILIPICIAVFPEAGDPLRIICISACMAGAVAGDHCSPISDTTIMASAGAQCDHVNHVNTQLPYVLCVAGVTFVLYIVAGLCKNFVLPWILGLAAITGILFIIKNKQKKAA